MQYYQNIFILLGALNVRAWFKQKTIVFSYALSKPQAVKTWADWIGNCPRSLYNLSVELLHLACFWESICGVAYYFPLTQLKLFYHPPALFTKTSLIISISISLSLSLYAAWAITFHLDYFFYEFQVLPLTGSMVQICIIPQKMVSFMLKMCKIHP